MELPSYLIAYVGYLPFSATNVSEREKGRLVIVCNKSSLYALT